MEQLLRFAALFQGTGCVTPKGESCLQPACALPTPSLPIPPGASADPVPPSQTSAALFREAGHPPGAGTAFGDGGDSVPLPAVPGGWPHSCQGAGVHSQKSPTAAGQSLPASPREQSSPEAGKGLLSPQDAHGKAGRSSRAALHADLERFPSPSGLTQARRTSASSW